MTTVDARGLPCPQPVIHTRRARRDSDRVYTLVSGEDQVGNVRRLAEKAGWRVSVDRLADHFAITLEGGEQTTEPELTSDITVCDLPRKMVVVVSSDEMGAGDAALGRILISGFFHALREAEPLPTTIVLYNGGAKLAVEGAEVLEDLQDLERRGVEILVCGTCLEYLHLRDHLAVGEVSNMYTILETLLAADHVVKP